MFLEALPNGRGGRGEQSGQRTSQTVANKDHALATFPITVALNCNSDQLSQRFHGVCVPIGGSKLGKAASWQINTEARPNIGETCEEMVELGQRPTETVDEYQQRYGGRFIGKTIEMWVRRVKSANGWIRRDRCGVRFIGGELPQDTGICLESC
jgi:hypothetical protein